MSLASTMRVLVGITLAVLCLGTTAVFGDGDVYSQYAVVDGHGNPLAALVAGEVGYVEITVTNDGPDHILDVKLDSFLPLWGLDEPPAPYDPASNQPWVHTEWPDGDSYDWIVEGAEAGEDPSCTWGDPTHEPSELGSSASAQWFFRTWFGRMEASDLGLLRFPVVPAAGGVATSVLECSGAAAVTRVFAHRPGSLGYPLEGGLYYDFDAPLELVDDGNGNSVGCTIPVDFSPGNIALIDRGDCSFDAKIQNADFAGAVAVIIINDNPGQELFGDDGILMLPTTLIEANLPATIVHYDDGQLLKANLADLRARLYAEFPANRGETSWTLDFLTYTYQFCPDYTSPNDPNGDNNVATFAIPVVAGPTTPVADFSHTPVGPRVTDEVTFTDTSTASPASWDWDFGDGTTSSDQHPTHTYYDPGGYSVTLTVTYSNTSATVSHLVEVSDGGPPPFDTAVYVMAAANLAGAADTQWSTDLQVVNTGRYDLVSYDIELLVTGEDNTTPATAGPFNLHSGVARRHVNPLEDLFEYQGSAALRVVFLGFSERDIVVNSRTFNATPAGTFGQGIMGIVAGNATPAGTEVYLNQLSEDASFRTNLGCVNATAAVLTVNANFHAADGSSLGSTSWELQPYEHFQENQAFTKAPINATDVADGYVVVWTDTTDGRFFCYASVVDNRTGDPTIVYGM